MRRKDREMPRDFGLGVIDRAAFGTLSVTDETGAPYSVPLSIVRENENLYFHSARAGRKVDLLQDGTTVCVAFVANVCVPELYSDEELAQLQTESEKASELTSRIFTTEYESAVVFGKISRVETDGEKQHALRLICQKYTPSKMDLFDLAVQSGMRHTLIYKIAIDELTAKRKKFDAEGVEMKWGRMSD